MEWQALYRWIGSNADTILWWQMSIRAAIIFFYALLLVRMGSKRIFGKSSSFDIVLSVILGSILSRTLTANASFFPTLAAGATLVMLHLVIAYTSLWSRRFGHLVKGKEAPLIEEGEINWPALRRHAITLHDLEEAARSQGKVMTLGRVQYAYLERSGDISIIT